MGATSGMRVCHVLPLQAEDSRGGFGLVPRVQWASELTSDELTRKLEEHRGSPDLLLVSSNKSPGSPKLVGTPWDKVSVPPEKVLRTFDKLLRILRQAFAVTEQAPTFA